MPLLQSVLYLCATVAAAQYTFKEEGDVCLNASGGKPAWVCKITSECPAALKLIRAEKFPPTKLRCGFKGKLPVICCPPYEIQDWDSIIPLNNAVSNRHPDLPPKNTPVLDDKPSKTAVKCKEYTKLAWENTQFNESSEPIKTHCGIFQRFVPTNDAYPKEFPHMALLGFGPSAKYLCSGSLISDRFVLSAAHCESHPINGLVQSVLLGDLDISSKKDDAMPIKYTVSNIFVHPNYKPGSPYHDIMLLELEHRVKFSQYVRPLCLHGSHSIFSNIATATGWSRLDSGGPSATLQFNHLSFLSHTTCSEAFKTGAGSQSLTSGIDDETQLCAGTEMSRESCQGDSGGPLQISLGDCMYSQVGVASFGTACGEEKLPGLYTRVSAYVPWIESIVWP